MSLVPLTQTSYRRLLVFLGLVLKYFQYRIAALVTCQSYFAQRFVVAVVEPAVTAEAAGETVDTGTLANMLAMMVDNNMGKDAGYTAACYFLVFHSLIIPP